MVRYNVRFRFKVKGRIRFLVRFMFRLEVRDRVIFRFRDKVKKSLVEGYERIREWLWL